MDVKEPHLDSLDNQAGVKIYIAEIAGRLHDRLVDVSSAVRRSLEDQIPELRGDAALVDLLGTSVEGNVDTILYSLRYDIAVERVEAPTAALSTPAGWPSVGCRSMRWCAPTGWVSAG